MSDLQQIQVLYKNWASLCTKLVGLSVFDPAAMALVKALDTCADSLRASIQKAAKTNPAINKDARIAPGIPFNTKTLLSLL